MSMNSSLELGNDIKYLKSILCKYSIIQTENNNDFNKMKSRFDFIYNQIKNIHKIY